MSSLGKVYYNRGVRAERKRQRDWLRDWYLKCEGREGANYLNGQSDKYPGEAWDDLQDFLWPEKKRKRR